MARGFAPCRCRFSIVRFISDGFIYNGGGSGYKQGGTLRSNYYVNCAVGGNTSNIGCDGADITDNDITLTGRTLYKDDKWNTICLPFSMTAAQMTAQLAPAPTSS